MLGSVIFSAVAWNSLERRQGLISFSLHQCCLKMIDALHCMPRFSFIKYQLFREKNKKVLKVCFKFLKSNFNVSQLWNKIYAKIDNDFPILKLSQPSWCMWKNAVFSHQSKLGTGGGLGIMLIYFNYTNYFKFQSLDDAIGLLTAGFTWQKLIFVMHTAQFTFTPTIVRQLA